MRFGFTLGRGGVTPKHLAHLQKLLRPADRRQLLQDLRFAPAWMHPYLRSISGKDKPS